MKARLYRMAFVVEHRRHVPRGARRGLEVGLSPRAIHSQFCIDSQRKRNANDEGPERPQVVNSEGAATAASRRVVGAGHPRSTFV